VVLGLEWLRWQVRPLVQELERSRNAALTSEARFRAAAESSLDPFFIFHSLRQETTGEVLSFRLVYANRPAEELTPLLDVIEQVASDLSAPDQPWLVHPVGALDLLPDSTARALKEAAAATSGKRGLHVNVAVGYGGRREIADAVRSMLQENEANGLTIGEVAETLDVDHIAEHLYTKGQPDPDLVIRTSGEQRLSGFLLWQSAHSEFYFCEACWPDFRRTDFLRALRSYGERGRRYGS